MGSVSLSAEELKLQRIPCAKDAAKETEQIKKKEEQPGALDALRRRLGHEGREIIMSALVVSAILALYSLSGLHGLWVRFTGQLF